MKNDHTTMFDLNTNKNDKIRLVTTAVCEALKEKGYDPISQLVGYILSGDPSYITSHNGARSMISKLERDEILEAVFSDYLADK